MRSSIRLWAGRFGGGRRDASSGNPAHRRRAHAPAAGMRFDRRVGLFVRVRSSRLVSRLNTGRKTHLPQRAASPTSEKRIASLQFENASQTNCPPDKFVEHMRQTRPGSLIEMMAGYIQEDC